MASDPANFFGLGLLVVGACGSGWYGFRQLGQARLLGDTPTSRVRSAAQGFVELKGTLMQGGGELLEAPLTGAPCLWWSYRIEEYRSNGKNSSWKTLESGRSEAWLTLQDDTGRCLINPVGAEVYPASRDVWHGRNRHPRQRESRGLLMQLLASGSRYRYTEERLHIGEALYAIGEFRTSGGGRQGLDLKQAQGEVIREWKQDFPALLARFDRNADGRFDEAEWAAVRKAAQIEAELRHRRRSVSEPELNHLRKPDEGLPFILSSHGEEQLVQRLRWQSFGSLLLCLVLTAVAGLSAVRLGLLPAGL